jgi:hypothetical protein
MSIIIEVFEELLGMFIADIRLTIATLVLVAIVAGIVTAAPEYALWAGGLLLAGALAIVTVIVLREARIRRAAG